MANGKTLSVIAGTTDCNARCPFCISKTTPFQGMTPKLEPINKERFERACELAKRLGIDTMLITGKGEPTLHPSQVSQYLEYSQQFNFSNVELQTNAILFARKPEKFDPLLGEWAKKGLNCIAISIVHFNKEKNREVYTPKGEYPDLPAVIKRLHGFGYKVRLSCTLVEGYVDSIGEAKNMIEFAAKNGVEQLTLRRMEAVEHSEDEAVSAWTRAHQVSKGWMGELKKFLEQGGKVIDRFFYGAALFEYGPGKQNVCLTTGLTDKILTEDIRQLIFFPSGRAITDWRYDSSKEDELRQIDGIVARCGNEQKP